MQTTDKYFLNYVNLYLKRRNMEINDFSTDFSDGIKLVAFLEEISGMQRPRKLIPNPKNEILKRQNLQTAMDMIRQMLGKDRTIFVDNSNFLYGKPNDVKLIIGFIFELVLHFSVNDVQFDEESASKGKDGLLMWCKKMVEPHGIPVNDFIKSWVDGAAFLCLCYEYDNNCVNIEEELNNMKNETDLSNEERIEKNKNRIQKALELIKNVMQADVILDEQFAVTPDDKANITQLSIIFSKFSEKRSLKKTRNTISNMIKRAMEIEKMQNDFINNVQECQKIIKEKEDQITELESKTDLKEKELKELIGNLYQLNSQGLQELQVKINALHSLLFTINETRQSFGHKTGFQLEEEQKPETLSQKVNSLSTRYIDLISKQKLKLEEIKSQTVNLRKEQWKKMFTMFAKEDPAQEKLTKDELVQLLTALSQEATEEQLENLYKDPEVPVTFEVFCTLMDQLENDNETDEQCLQAFKKLGGEGDYVTENLIRNNAGLNEQEIQWLLKNMKKIDGQEGQYDYKDLIEKLYD